MVICEGGSQLWSTLLLIVAVRFFGSAKYMKIVGERLAEVVAAEPIVR